MIKAALGGGGRGMRVVYRKEEVQDSYERAVGEAIKAFWCWRMLCGEIY